MAQMENFLGTAHIATNYSNYESARTAFFSFFINQADAANLLKLSYTNADAEPTDADKYKEQEVTDGIKLNVISCPVPHFSLGTEEYRRGNEVIKFATVPTWDGGTIKVQDVVGMDTKSLLMAWQYLAYNPNTRKGGKMVDYKKTCTLVEYSQAGEIIRTWTVEGCFITKITEEDFDKENDGKRVLSADISFDRAIVQLAQ